MTGSPEIRQFSGQDLDHRRGDLLSALDAGAVVLVDFRVPGTRGHPFRGETLILQVLSRILDQQPGEISLEKNPWGKPFLPSQDGTASLYFNLSHSGTLAVLALYRHGEVGMDVEEKVPRSDPGRLVRRFFSPGEQSWFFSPEISAQEETLRLDQYYRLWCRKEAVVKALGRGLGYGLGKFDASPPSLNWRTVTTDSGETLIVRDLELRPGWAASLALRCPEQRP